jgi:ABC-type transport system involved in cytochrome c biogenesis permease subunit
MPLFIKIGFLFFAAIFIVAGLLMVVAPLKYPELLAGFLNERVMKRQTTVRDKAFAIRTQGLIALTAGSLFALFVWALS